MNHDRRTLAEKIKNYEYRTFVIVFAPILPLPAFMTTLNPDPITLTRGLPGAGILYNIGLKNKQQ